MSKEMDYKDENIWLMQGVCLECMNIETMAAKSGFTEYHFKAVLDNKRG